MRPIHRLIAHIAHVSLLGLWGAAQAQPDLVSLALQGDALRGLTVYENRCFGCHSVDANRTGPMHRGVWGRKAGGLADFVYSEALQKSRVVWRADTLNQWLKDPQAFIPGQAMNVRVDNAQDRADLVAYLATLGHQSR